MKSKIVALLLCFFLGWVGMHRFYLGENKRGMIYLLFCWTGIPLFLSIFDFIGIVFTPEEKLGKGVKKDQNVVIINHYHQKADAK